MAKTLGEVYLELRRTLKKEGVAGYTIEARELVCHAMGIEREEFHQKRDMFIFDKSQAKIDETVALRLSGTPIQYITGKWEFYSLPFLVTTDTLIPRADTEILVDTAVAFLANREKGRILDLCCGTGCIGISVLANVSDQISGVLMDVSEAALQVARKNIALNNLTARTLTFCGDALQPPDSSLGRFNLIVSNPPYIRTDELDQLDPEVKCEPQIALDGGGDGLMFYRSIVKGYKPLLQKGGCLMMEVGLSQWEDVRQLMKNYGYQKIRIIKDLEGIERVVCGVADPNV